MFIGGGWHFFTNERQRKNQKNDRSYSIEYSFIVLLQIRTMMKVVFRAELKFNVCPRNFIRAFIFDFFVGLIIFCSN